MRNEGFILVGLKNAAARWKYMSLQGHIYGEVNGRPLQSGSEHWKGHPILPCPCAGHHTLYQCPNLRIA